MLWDIVYAFYVKNVFGGYFDNVAYSTTFNGRGIFLTNLNLTNFDYPITLGNYLSLIATIITMISLVIVCIIIFKKIFNICFNLFTGRSIF